MWSHRIVQSSDPEEFVTLIRPSGLKMLVTERGTFEGSSTLMEIGGLYLQRRSERLARFVEIDMPRPGILFLVRPGPSMFFDGAEIGHEELALVGSGHGYVSRLSGPTRWGHILFDQNELEVISTSYLGCSAARISGCRVITPSSGALARLRSLHAAAEDLTAAFPESLMCPGIERGLEQALLQATLDCFAVSSVHSETMAMQHHRIIIRRFREMLETHPLNPLHMQHVSRSVGVSGRTLRMACQEHFGVSPTQYLLLRRMHLAHRALQQAHPQSIRVTEIATELGFWELGRFAVKYRQIFGESPSTTLRTGGVPDPQPTESSYALA
jgi:AraC-like DNA-binding protein